MYYYYVVVVVVVVIMLLLCVCDIVGVCYMLKPDFTSK